MRVGVLGAAEARLDGAVLDLGTRKQRAVLAALALHRGQPVRPDALVDLLWGDAPPAAVTTSLQGYVAGLRRVLEPNRAPRTEARVLVTREGGYALDLPPGSLDAEAFESAVTEAHGHLGAGLVVPPGPTDLLERLHARLDEGLALWRGSPYAELADAPDAAAERGRLEELRVVALEDRAAAALALGRHATVAGELESLTARHPLRERLWGLRALALTRSGRQAEALDVLRQVRDLLAEELGLEPGQELRDLQTAVLRQDPALAWQGGPVRATPREAPPASPFGWPLVGRDDELAALTGLLDRSSQEPAFAAVTGEPGIGKSRLCFELATRARADGATVVVGRCSQDEGAPPLYPWATVLRALGHDLPGVEGAGDGEGAGVEDGAARFRAWEGIVGLLLEESRRRHLVVFLDDLHWADSSTLRVLRLLAETADSGQLLVVCTWRQEPPPTGQLAVVADMLARRHALRLELAGLTADQASDVVAAVAASTPTSTEAAALRVRTDGNPFFLVEYARLAHDRGDLSALLREEHPPAAVHDVLTRRIAGLPEGTVAILRHACVVGRAFDVRTLAEVAGADEDGVLDALDPALAAGLVRELGVDRFMFAHALVRDTAYAALSQSRRARMHARTAEVLTGVPGRESEVARHWLAAGPSYAERAWRAARDAARAAREVYAYDEAVELLTGALRVLEEAGASDAERYEVLLDLARSHQQVDNLVALRETVHAALAAAEGDVHRELRAVGLLVTRALWQGGAFGAVDTVVVDAIRRCLDGLPEGDGEERCRAMLALCTEIYYATSGQERDALSEQALAMARRIGDPRLLLDTLLAVPVGLWSPATAPTRLALTAEAATVARELGDGPSLVIALALHASAASESGQVEGLAALVLEAREQAEKERQLFVQLFLDGLEIPWVAMRGDFDTVRSLTAHMVAMHERIDVPQTGDALVGAFLMELLWSDQADALVSVLDQVDQVRVLPVDASVALILARAGRLEEARARLTRVSHELSPDWWFSLLTLSMTAEAAMRTGSSELAAAAYAVLAPFAGRPAAGGSGTIVGVVDFFLAMAAHATGEHDLAARHADEGLRLCEAWDVPLAAGWFRRLREEFGF